MSDDHSDRMYNANATSVEFQGWPKTPRLLKSMTVTEKIDGTNACVVVVPHPVDNALRDDVNRVALVHNADSIDEELKVWKVYAQSRNRMIIPDRDNAGFAKWVQDNAKSLVEVLGPGRHYGEWWGAGIQRTYGAQRKTFSLFNTDKHGDLDPAHELWGLSVVPELYRGPFSTDIVHEEMDYLRRLGSNVAAPGWTGEAEGLCVFHHASRTVFKATLEYDGPKGEPSNVVELSSRERSGCVERLTRAMPDPDQLAVA